MEEIGQRRTDEEIEILRNQLKLGNAMAKKIAKEKGWEFADRYKNTMKALATNEIRMPPETPTEPVGEQ